MDTTTSSREHIVLQNFLQEFDHLRNSSDKLTGQQVISGSQEFIFLRNIDTGLCN